MRSRPAASRGRSVRARDDERDHRRARRRLAGRRDAAWGESCRGTGRRRWRGTSPPTTAGTRRPTRPPSARPTRRRRRRCSRPGCAIPGGDAVHRVWSVADGGGRTSSRSPTTRRCRSPCAFTRRDLLTARPPADVPIEGIDLPPATIVLPIGHRAVGDRRPRPPRPPGRSAARPGRRPRRRRRAAGSPAPSGPAGSSWADPSAVEALRRGARRGRARRTAGRRRRPGRPPPRRRPSWSGWASWDERDAVAVVPDVAAAVERAAVDPSPLADAALDAAGVVLAPAGERRALADLARILAGATGRRRPGAGRVRASPRSQRSSDASPRRTAASPTASRRRGAASTSRPTGCSPARRRRCRSRCAGTAPNAAVLWEVDGATRSSCTHRPSTPSRGARASASGEALWRLDR